MNQKPEEVKQQGGTFIFTAMKTQAYLWFLHKVPFWELIN